MSITQKEAVYQAITNALIMPEAGAVRPSKEERASVCNILVAGFQSKAIAYDGDLPNEADLKSYVSGLLSNWLRKDKRLNGNINYVPKNPGSRTGITDPSIKAMKALLSTKSDPAECAEIQAFIDRRLAEVKPAKVVTVNVADLPEALRRLVKS